MKNISLDDVTPRPLPQQHLIWFIDWIKSAPDSEEKKTFDPEFDFPDQGKRKASNTLEKLPLLLFVDPTESASNIGGLDWTLNSGARTTLVQDQPPISPDLKYQEEYSWKFKHNHGYWNHVHEGGSLSNIQKEGAPGTNANRSCTN